MKNMILLSIIFLIPLSAYGQEESISELSERLDKENLEKAQQIQQGQSPQLSFEKVDCLPWQTEKALSGGGIECVDTGEGISADSGLYIVIGVIVFIIIIGGIAAVSRKKPKSETSQTLPRRGWTDAQHKEILKRQNGVCAICGEYSGSYQFDHKDDNHYNNDIDNAQALCPNCHDRKSRGLN